MTGEDWALTVAVVCMWVGGYATGRGRPIRRLVAWADWQYQWASRRAVWFWLGAAIVAVAIAGCLLFRPYRSWRNWHAWRDYDRRRAGPPGPPLDFAG
jgi:hypothetical protein